MNKIGHQVNFVQKSQPALPIIEFVQSVQNLMFYNKLKSLNC